MENKKVISVLEQKPTDGHSPHIVLTEDYERYVLKSPNNRGDVISIQKEIICNCLLTIWDLKTPDAALLSTDKSIVSSFNKKLWGQTFFGSKFIPNAIDSNENFLLEKKVYQRWIKNLNDIFKIALFDIWVANDDRKRTNHNLLLCPTQEAFELYSIDHAFTFASLPFQDLLCSELNFSFNDSILHSSLGKAAYRFCKPRNHFCKDYSDFLYFCIEKSKIQYDEILAVLPQDLQLSTSDQNCLKKFLFNEDRLQQVLCLFCSILNDLK